MTFDDFFGKATRGEQRPYPFQGRFAEAASLYQLVDVPTGLGKTAMAILGWLWRRFHATDAIRRATPRRLVYCLPMRVLVEQTWDNALKWVKNLWKAGCLPHDVPIHILMGGEDPTDWAMYPEKEAILIGTQDMLLSRALNRGYAAGRARWPMEFGLLHNDCLWVYDEIQLMGPGLATTTQLEAFRCLLGPKDGHGCHSLWMSATLQRDWLRTVDFDLNWLGEPLTLSDDDLDDDRVEALWTANRPIQRANTGMDDLAGVADEILDAHKPGTRTIVVVNTVRRACDLYDKIAKKRGSTNDQRLVLLHSRFRPEDREAQIKLALAQPRAKGTIIVSTQVIEAGVDVSATTLFTELAPWASLVQRFGRCNRKGKENNEAVVYWIDVADKDAAPYEAKDLDKAREQLGVLRDVGIQSLPTVDLLFEHTHVIRKKDLIDLFDTTPDLAGNDIDIDRFIRDVEETDVRVFWRTWGRPHRNDPPPADNQWRRVGREELCPAPVGQFRTFTEEHRDSIWRWDHLEGQWIGPDTVHPGQVYLVHADAGGYDESQGWGPQHKKKGVRPLRPPTHRHREDDEYDDDGLSMTDDFQRIDQHTDRVCKALASVVDLAHNLPLSEREAEILTLSARWHDLGKVHPAFQIKIDDGQKLPDKGANGQIRYRRSRDGKWVEWAGCRFVAKAPGRRWDQAGNLVDEGFWSRGGKARNGFRRHFRHELASALAVLQRRHDDLKRLGDEEFNLVAYLVAAHHGKVRLSIRSMPNEVRPAEDRRFARGVWDGDILPETDLGGGVVAPEVRLSLEPMELGLCEQEPFKGQPSWTERMIRLRDSLGPFRLAYLEALLRAADWRASQPEDHT